MIATGSRDRTLRLWDITKPPEVPAIVEDQSTANVKLFVLRPFRSVTRHKIANMGPFGDYSGPAIPKQTSDQFVVVYFKIGRDTVSVADMNWLIKDEIGSQYKPIGFGCAEPETPVRMFGELTDGKIFGFNGGTERLLSLIFVLPTKAKLTLRLIDPKANEYKLAISRAWLPEEKNFVTNFRVGGGIRTSPAGEGWTLE
jgi:hypothetical protein